MLNEKKLTSLFDPKCMTIAMILSPENVSVVEVMRF